MNTDQPLPAWKLLDSQHVASLMRGEIMVRSLDYYADLEQRRNDRWIGDRFENGGERHLERYDSAQDDPAVRENLSPWISSTGGRIVVSNFTVKERIPHGHAFCVTVGDLNLQLDQFEYDTAVEIFDLRALGAAIMAEGRLLYAHDVRAADVFTAAPVAEVRYAEKRVTIESGETPESSPFVKPPSYSPQEEARIILWARDPLLHDEVFIKLPEPERFFGRKVQVAKPERIPVAAAAPLEEELASLLAEMRLFTDEWSEKLYQATSAVRDKYQTLPAMTETNSEEGARLREELFRPLRALQSERTRLETTLFRTRIMDLAWRARMEKGIRLRGTAQAMMMDTVEVILERLKPNAGRGPAMTSLRETRHFYPEDRRPPVPVLWRNTVFDTIGL